MCDYREELLTRVCNSLCSNGYDQPEISEIRNIFIVLLGDYEITERTTEIALRDSTSDELLKLYIGTLLTEGKSDKTVKQYMRVIQRFINDIGKPVTDVSVFEIRFWLASIQQTASQRTCENYRSYLSAFYQWLAKEELIEKNPMTRINPIKFEDVVRKAFTDVEIDSLRGACKTLRERAIVELLLSSGIRVAELSSMNREDIDFNTLEVTVKHGKGNKQRTTYISDVAKAHIVAYLESRSDGCEALLYSNKLGALSTGAIRNSLKNISKRCGVNDVHPHRFRRTFASNLVKKGMDIRTVQVLMGHSDLNTTMQYVSLSEEHVKNQYVRYA